MIKEAVLRSFGLTDAEIKAYITLLQVGEATASEIAKKTGTNRTFTYDRLKKLGDNGLVSSIIKDGKKYFKAAEPSQFLSILKEKEEQIKNILPELERLKQPVKLGPEVEVYSGVKGVQTVLNLMLREKQELYLYGTLKKFHETMPVYFEIWNKRRIKQKIKIKILSSENVNLDFSNSDLLPEEEQTVTSNFTFGNMILIIMWGHSPVAILIKSKEIAENNVVFFNTIWNREVKIYSDVNGVQRAFMELLEDTKGFVGFGYSKQLSDVYTVEFSDKWHVERIRNKIPCRIVAFREEKTKNYFKARLKTKKEFYVKFLDKELQGPACISLSDRMIATFVYTEKRLRVIINKNKETVKAYRKFFDELWEKAVP